VWETHRYFGSQVEGLRSTGSGALDLANLASGVTDIVYAFDQSEWDRTAGRFLVEIADGVVTGHDGGATSTGDFVASNEKLHERATDLK
jgi:myo-inositol-1(or 4)-monophosphatase